MNKAVILDRDGVVNEDSPDYIRSPDEWIPIQGSLEAIAKLNLAGYKVFLTSNQSGVNRGYFTLETLKKIHEKMVRLLKEAGGYFDGIYFCPHRPDENCHCRKPNIGMLEQIAKDHSIQLKNAIHIGDAIRDIQAAQKTGGKAILVLTGKGEKTLKDNPELKSQIPICKNLAEAVQLILT